MIMLRRLHWILYLTCLALVCQVILSSLSGPQLQCRRGIFFSNLFYIILTKLTLFYFCLSSVRKALPSSLPYVGGPDTHAHRASGLYFSSEPSAATSKSKAASSSSSPSSSSSSSSDSSDNSSESGDDASSGEYETTKKKPVAVASSSSSSQGKAAPAVSGSQSLSNAQPIVLRNEEPLLSLPASAAATASTNHSANPRSPPSLFLPHASTNPVSPTKNNAVASSSSSANLDFLFSAPVSIWASPALPSAPPSATPPAFVFKPSSSIERTLLTRTKGAGMQVDYWFTRQRRVTPDHSVVGLRFYNKTEDGISDIRIVDSPAIRGFIDIPFLAAGSFYEAQIECSFGGKWRTPVHFVVGTGNGDKFPLDLTAPVGELVVPAVDFAELDFHRQRNLLGGMHETKLSITVGSPITLYSGMRITPLRLSDTRFFSMSEPRCFAVDSCG